MLANLDGNPTIAALARRGNLEDVGALLMTSLEELEVAEEELREQNDRRLVQAQP